MRGDPRMMRQGSRRAGADGDQWERGKPLPPMPGMQQGGGCVARCPAWPAEGWRSGGWRRAVAPRYPSLPPDQLPCTSLAPHCHPCSYDGRGGGGRGPPPGMRGMPGMGSGPLPRLHKTGHAYKVRGRRAGRAVWGS